MPFVLLAPPFAVLVPPFAVLVLLLESPPPPPIVVAPSVLALAEPVAPLTLPALTEVLVLEPALLLPVSAPVVPVVPSEVPSLPPLSAPELPHAAMVAVTMNPSVPMMVRFIR